MINATFSPRIEDLLKVILSDSISDHPSSSLSLQLLNSVITGESVTGIRSCISYIVAINFKIFGDDVVLDSGQLSDQLSALTDSFAYISAAKAHHCASDNELYCYDLTLSICSIFRTLESFGTNYSAHQLDFFIRYSVINSYLMRVYTVLMAEGLVLSQLDPEAREIIDNSIVNARDRYDSMYPLGSQTHSFINNWRYFIKNFE